MHLSEKAKGKQRAIDEDDLESGLLAPPALEQPRLFTVRFTEGLEDLVLCARPKDTVKDIREQIRIERPQLRNRRLRLIHHGRLLTDGTLLHGWLMSLEDRQKRAVASTGLGPASGIKSDDPIDPVVDGQAWIHCSVGQEIPEGEVEDPYRVQTAQIKPVRGFDRLASAGFSVEEIATIRRQFHREQPLADGLDIESDDYDEHARALEEQWIDNLDANDASSPGAGDSYSTTMLQGLLTGFFFPLFPLYFMREYKPVAFFGEEDPDRPEQQADAVSSVIFSRRMNMAMIIGLILNISTSVILLLQ